MYIFLLFKRFLKKSIGWIETFAGVLLFLEPKKKNPIRRSAALPFDSRMIEPPQIGNITERVICDSIYSAKVPSENRIGTISWALPYSVAEVHASIYWLKYKRHHYTVEFLARILWDEMRAAVFDNLNGESRAQQRFIICHSPSTSFANGSKSWDHCADIVKELNPLTNVSGLKFEFAQIFKIKQNTRMDSAKHKSRRDRLASSRNKFELDGVAIQQLKLSENKNTLVIFDDVTTTGSTLLELKQCAGQSALFNRIFLFAIAH